MPVPPIFILSSVFSVPVPPSTHPQLPSPFPLPSNSLPLSPLKSYEKNSTSFPWVLLIIWVFLGLWILAWLSYTLSVISTYKSRHNIQYFWVWVIPLRMMFFYSIPFACMMSLFLMPECSLCNGMTSFIYSSTEAQKRFFFTQFLSIMNKAAMNIVEEVVLGIVDIFCGQESYSWS